MPWKHMGEWRYSSTILDLGTRGRWVVNFTPLPLYLRGRRSRYLFDMRLGGLQGRSGPCGEQKNLALPRIKPGPFSLYPIAELPDVVGTYLLTYLRSWALLEKPPIVQPLKNFPAFYGTRRLITAFTRAPQWCSQINPVHTIPSYLYKIHFNIVHPPTSWSS
jgi:hypothetical protein